MDQPTVRITSNVVIDIEHQTLQDMLITACEGGSQSWLNGVRIGQRPPDGTPLPPLSTTGRWTTYTVMFGGGSIIIDHDQATEQGTTETEVDLQKMIEALRLMAKTNSHRFGKIMDLGGAVDGDVADVFLQYVVYGEEVFA